MSTIVFGVKFDEIQLYDWQSVPAPIVERDAKHHGASDYFFPKAAALREAGDELGERVFRFLGAVSSLFPNFESKRPLHPKREDVAKMLVAIEDVP